MQFRLEFSSSWTVKQSENLQSGWQFDSSQGAWWLSISSMERYLKEAIADFSCGDSVNCYIFGFEIGDSSAGIPFDETTCYISYRPKTKTIVSVGQLDWPDIRHLEPKEQFAKFRQILLESVSRISTMKRKPRDFQHENFYSVINQALQQTDGLQFASP